MGTSLKKSRNLSTSAASAMMPEKHALNNSSNVFFKLANKVAGNS